MFVITFIKFLAEQRDSSTYTTTLEIRSPTVCVGRRIVTGSKLWYTTIGGGHSVKCPSIRLLDGVGHIQNTHLFVRHRDNCQLCYITKPISIIDGADLMLSNKWTAHRAYTMGHHCKISFALLSMPYKMAIRLERRHKSKPHKFSHLCSGFASISGTTSGKSEVGMSTPVALWRRPWTRVMRVALVVTSVSRRAVWQARYSTSRLFPVPKCMG